MTWWEAINLNLSNLVAGFSGGVVASFAATKSDPREVIASVVVGSLTANYLTMPVSKYFSLGTSEHVAAFLIGLGGIGFVKGIIKVMHKFQPMEKDPPANG